MAIERPIGPDSTMRQVVRLDAGSPRLEFHCEADWRESNTMLKVLFPVAVHAPNATYQMQFGHAERPTHYSTSHDLARYEVPGHRFADLSEHGFGVALLTDCKYGYSTYGNEMRISLLRSPQMPDPDADVGQHEFAYAVMPHAGGWREAGVVAEAARFESPIRWAPAAEGRSFFAVDDPNLVLDTVKRAEDSDALVLRLYECHGARGTARLRVGVPFTAARLCNLLEDPGAELPVSDGEIELAYRPHEIISVLVAGVTKGSDPVVTRAPKLAPLDEVVGQRRQREGDQHDAQERRAVAGDRPHHQRRDHQRDRGDRQPDPQRPVALRPARHVPHAVPPQRQQDERRQRQGDRELVGRVGRRQRQPVDQQPGGNDEAGPPRRQPHAAGHRTAPPVSGSKKYSRSRSTDSDTGLPSSTPALRSSRAVISAPGSPESR